MMERILIRYVLRNKHTQALHFKTYYLEQIEEGGIGKLFDVENYTVISRDRFAGLLDKNGTKIFEHDILEGTSYLYGYQLTDGEQFDYKGFVKFQTQADVGLMWVLEDEDGSCWHLNQTVHRNDIDYYTGVVTGNIFDHETA